MSDVLRIDGVEIALAIAQIMNGIEQICLTRTIIAHKAIDLLRKLQICFEIILKID
jgi:hypothetical protein